MGENLREYSKYILFFIVLAAIAFGGINVLKMTLGTNYPLMVVVSQSMDPTLGVGDFILVGKINDTDNVVAEPAPEGDILVFIKPRTSSEYIVHRAVEKYMTDTGWFFVTKGDNNALHDLRPVNEENVLGKVVGRIPIVGFFPLFIKTTRGFALVVALMGIVFFADNLMPTRREGNPDTKFPYISLLPFIPAPLVLLSFLFLFDSQLMYETIALAAWYLGCLIAPFAFDDDDMGLMLWLYHFVLFMVPLGCDMVWRRTGLTPSLWWETTGSIMPLTWLLQTETVMFIEAFNQFAILTLPGCLLFFIIMGLKRRGVGQLEEYSRKFRKILSF